MKKKSVLVYIGVGIVTIAVTCIVLFGNGKIKEKDYEIIDNNATYVTINRKIGNMSNLEYIFDDLHENHNNTVYYLNDDRHYFSLYKGFNQYNELTLTSSGVCRNIGTIENPKWGEEDYNKTKELNQYLERYYENKK